MLFFACVFWGLSFIWAKVGGQTVNQHVGHPDGSTIGPVWLLAVRFAIASVIWMAIMPAAWRGWDRKAFADAIVLGGLMAGGMTMQNLGLEKSQPGITAFLTSLVVVFVPVISWITLGKRPSSIVAAGVCVAIAGIWLMTGASPTGFGLGEVFAIAGSLIWAVYILAVSGIAKRQHPARMVAAQLIGTLVVSSAWILLQQDVSIAALVQSTHDRRVWMNILLLTIFSTLVGYGILTYYQPKIDATRASLIYLAEPVYAALFAWLLIGMAMSRVEIIGASLILIANVAVEVLGSRARVVVPD
jgi:drug/metabolite transporter (DMT)-like permease